MAGARMVGAVRRWTLARTGAEREGGFVLLESMVAIGIITVVMTAVGALFVVGVASASEQRSHQGAVQVADSTVEQIRALHPSDLVTGRDPASVTAQIASAPALVKPWLDDMDAATDPSAGTDAGRTAAVPTSSAQVTPGSITYTVNQYLGRCSVRTSGGDDCVPEAGLHGAAATSYLRAVVAVTWSGRGCSRTRCGYVTSTLIDTASDRTFRINSAPYAAPVIVSPGPRTNVAGDSVSLQLHVQDGTGVPDFRWAQVGGDLPAGLALSPTGHITGTVSGPVGSFSAAVQVTDAFGRTADRPQTIAWTVARPVTLTDPGPQAAQLVSRPAWRSAPRAARAAPTPTRSSTTAFPRD